MMENSELLMNLKAEFPSTKVVYDKFDITDKNGIKNTLENIVSTIGNIDVLVNGAGVFWEDKIEQMIAINLVSTLFFVEIAYFIEVL